MNQWEEQQESRFVASLLFFLVINIPCLSIIFHTILIFKQLFAFSLATSIGNTSAALIYVLLRVAT